MAIQNLSKREKTILIIAAICAVIALSFNFFIEPLVVKWKVLNDTMLSKEKLLKGNMLLLQRYDDLEREYSKYPKLIKREAAEEKEVQAVLSEIEKISKKSSCYILNIKPRATRQISQYKEISFEVTVEGDMPQSLKFMYGIETSETLLKIKRFIIASTSGSTGTLKSTFIISKLLL